MLYGFSFRRKNNFFFIGIKNGKITISPRNKSNKAFFSSCELTRTTVREQKFLRYITPKAA